MIFTECQHESLEHEPADPSVGLQEASYCTECGASVEAQERDYDGDDADRWS